MILLIDNYDSFVYNLYQYIGEALANIRTLDLNNSEDFSIIDKEIKVIRNDELTVEEIKELNPDYIIISPGPGKPEDAGISEELVSEFLDLDVPILGICLGHQAICQSLGCEVVHANRLMHGKTSNVNLVRDDLFKNLNDNIQVARYHSLIVSKDTLVDDINIIASTFDDEIMGIKYKDSKIYGLQFHPESILSPEGMKIIENFLVL